MSDEVAVLKERLRAKIQKIDRIEQARRAWEDKRHRLLLEKIYPWLLEVFPEETRRVTWVVRRNSRVLDRLPGIKVTFASGRVLMVRPLRNVSVPALAKIAHDGDSFTIEPDGRSWLMHRWVVLAGGMKECRYTRLTQKSFYSALCSMIGS